MVRPARCSHGCRVECGGCRWPGAWQSPSNGSEERGRQKRSSIHGATSKGVADRWGSHAARTRYPTNPTPIRSRTTRNAIPYASGGVPRAPNACPPGPILVLGGKEPDGTSLGSAEEGAAPGPGQGDASAPACLQCCNAVLPPPDPDGLVHGSREDLPVGSKRQGSDLGRARAGCTRAGLSLLRGGSARAPDLEAGDSPGDRDR